MVWSWICFGICSWISLSLPVSAVALEKTTACLNNKTINLEIAKTPLERERGLMFRESMASDAGMLFVYDKPIQMNFWMKNTYIDLSIGFFDQKMKLVEVQEMQAMPKDYKGPLASYPSSKLVMYALEMNKYWFKNNGVTTGARLELNKKCK